MRNRHLHENTRLRNRHLHEHRQIDTCMKPHSCELDNFPRLTNPHTPRANKSCTDPPLARQQDTRRLGSQPPGSQRTPQGLRHPPSQQDTHPLARSHGPWLDCTVLTRWPTGSSGIVEAVGSTEISAVPLPPRLDEHLSGIVQERLLHDRFACQRGRRH